MTKIIILRGNSGSGKTTLAKLLQKRMGKGTMLISRFAYYFDLPFEETLLRHSTRDAYKEFGEKEMRLWWKEKDLINIFPETILAKVLTSDEIIDKIFSDVKN